MPYKQIKWDELLIKDKFAYYKFEEHVKQWINNRPLRLCFRAALPEGTPITTDSVMRLFTLTVKHNFNSMIAVAKPELMALIVASGADFSRPYYNGSMPPGRKCFKYVLSSTHRYWDNVR